MKTMLLMVAALLLGSGCAGRQTFTLSIADGVDRDVVREAAGAWVTAAGGEIEIMFLDSWEPSADITIELHDYSNAQKCGETHHYAGRARVMIDPKRDRCGDYLNLVEHEMGHALGSSEGGCDGLGHSCVKGDVLYSHIQIGVHTPTAHDVDLVMMNGGA